MRRSARLSFAIGLLAAAGAWRLAAAGEGATIYRDELAGSIRRTGEGVIPFSDEASQIGSRPGSRYARRWRRRLLLRPYVA